MEPLIHLEGVSKKYGWTKALSEVSLRIESGKIIGLLGENGSGKSTLMKLIAGIARPSAGSVNIEGKKAGLSTRSAISFLPDRSVLEPWMRVGDAVRFYSDFYSDFNKERAAGLLRFMKLEPQQHVLSLSKGMKERLEVALVLSRDAKLYLLDEPIGGVDPVARDKILDAIVQFFRPPHSFSYPAIWPIDGWRNKRRQACYRSAGVLMKRRL